MKIVPSFLAEIFIPAMIVISNTVADERRFTHLDFPPFRCEEERNYYRNLLPQNITQIVTIFILATIGWVIHKVWAALHQKMEYITEFKNGHKSPMITSLFYILQRKQCTAEMKIVTVFTYFMIYLILINSYSALFTAEFEPLRNAINSHFLCEAVGYVPGRCSRESFEQYSHPLLNIAVYIGTMLLPVVHLLFIINCRVLKEKIEKLKVIQSLKSTSSKSTE